MSFSVSFSDKARCVCICCLCGDISCKFADRRCEIGLLAFSGAYVICLPFQTALLLIVLVVPTLHIVRAGIDENIAFLLLGFGIILSDDRMEVVRIVTFYTWLLEGTLTNLNTNLGSVSS